MCYDAGISVYGEDEIEKPYRRREPLIGLINMHWCPAKPVIFNCKICPKHKLQSKVFLRSWIEIYSKRVPDEGA